MVFFTLKTCLINLEIDIKNVLYNEAELKLYKYIYLSIYQVLCLIQCVCRIHVNLKELLQEY